MNLFRSNWKRPDKVYLLGRLREIELEGGKTLLFKGNSVYVAGDRTNRQLFFPLGNRVVGRSRAEMDKELKDSYSDFHWGDKPGTVIKLKHLVPPNGEVTTLGKAVRIDYASVKDGKNAEYTHTHNSPYPTLAKSGTQLYYIGGKYTIEGRGIVH